MILNRLCRGLLFVATVAFVGCGPTGRVSNEKTIKVVERTALNQAKDYLNRYASGQAIGSEAEDFDRIVTEIKSHDPATAAILREGFDELLKPGTNIQAKAKEILRKLAPYTGS